MNELKPCPFCGGNDLFILSEDYMQGRLTDGDNTVFGFVSCNKCGATVESKPSPFGFAAKDIPDIAKQLFTGSADKWNRRAVL